MTAGVHDSENGAVAEVRGHRGHATGVWTDEISSVVQRGRFQVRASKGVHVVVLRLIVATSR